jgi:hypothetical protein
MNQNKQRPILKIICTFTFAFIFAFIALTVLAAPLLSNTYYVSKASGKNSNPGTKEQPFKNIDKALKIAGDGDTVNIAGGVYSGAFDIGYIDCKKAVKLIGSFAPDFSARDIKQYPTVFQPDNKSGGRSRKPLLRFSGNVDGLVVDGFVFDMGNRNAYHDKKGRPGGLETGMLLLPPQKMSGQKATVTEACLSIPSAARGGDIVIRNNVFINSAKFGIQAGLRKGSLKITDNVFIANRMAAIEVYGTCRSTGGPKTLAQCGEVEIAYNTILFSWSRTKEMLDMGYGIRIMTKLKYDIHHNIIAGNVLAGVDHSRFNKDEWISMNHNVFFANKMADLEYSPASNTKLNLRVEQFGDLEFGACGGNSSQIPKTLAFDKAYLAGFLAARYSEQSDYNPDSPANQLREIVGLNKQGKLTSKVTMYGNRYPWKKALELFGSVKGHGARHTK